MMNQETNGETVAARKQTGTARTHKTCRRGIASSLLLLVGCLAGTPVHAASGSYPVRPVRVLVPFAPGGGADTLGRIITPKLTEGMGQQWVVDNRGGAAGNIAA